MEAADESKRQGGAPVKLDAVMLQAGARRPRMMVVIDENGTIKVSGIAETMFTFRNLCRTQPEQNAETRSGDSSRSPCENGHRARGR